MTQEIKRKIADAVKQYAENNSPKQLVIPAYHDAAHFGYSLASAELEAANRRIGELEAELLCERSANELKNNRIKELEEGLKNLRHGTFMNIAAINSYIDQLLNK